MVSNRRFAIVPSFVPTPYHGLGGLCFLCVRGRGILCGLGAGGRGLAVGPGALDGLSDGVDLRVDAASGR